MSPDLEAEALTMGNTIASNDETGKTRSLSFDDHHHYSSLQNKECTAVVREETPHHPILRHSEGIVHWHVLPHR